MTKRKAIRLHEIERNTPHVAALRQEGGKERANHVAEQVADTHWPELFAAVGGDKMVGNSKP
jgi:hypothetical protein